MLGTQDRTHRESRDLGRTLRKEVPRSSHAEWTPPPDRADPVALLDSQNADRLPWLVPVRFGRMSPSAFTFYRGGAKIMANAGTVRVFVDEEYPSDLAAGILGEAGIEVVRLGEAGRPRAEEP